MILNARAYNLSGIIKYKINSSLTRWWTDFGKTSPKFQSFKHKYEGEYIIVINNLNGLLYIFFPSKSSFFGRIHDGGDVDGIVGDDIGVSDGGDGDTIGVSDGDVGIGDDTDVSDGGDGGNPITVPGWRRWSDDIMLAHANDWFAAVYCRSSRSNDPVPCRGQTWTIRVRPDLYTYLK